MSRGSRRFTVSTSATVAVMLVALAVAGAARPATADAGYSCPPADPVLEGAPNDMPAAPSPVPLRSDPDGSSTITLAVDDPAGAASSYQYTPIEVGGAPVAGVFSHRWTTIRSLVTYGVYAGSGPAVTRFPLLVVENGPSTDVVVDAMTVFAREAHPLAGNSATFALNTIAPTATSFAGLLALAALLAPESVQPVNNPPVTSPQRVPVPTSLLADLARAWTAQSNASPDASGFDNQLPVYFWSTFRTTPGGNVWQGFVVTHNGNAMVTRDGTQTVRDACRRTRLATVTRSASGTQLLGGMYVLDKIHSTDAGTSPGAFDLHETITTGTTAAAGSTWVDVPVAVIEQDEHKQGQTQYVTYADQQTDTVTVGLAAGSDVVPLLGTRADTVHAAPPDAERRLVSVGVFDPLRQYHPVLGVREHFERFPADLWFDEWGKSGGPGSRTVGDWQIDAGVFDPLGNFIGLVRTAHDDEFTGHRDEYRMMISAGVLVAERYFPLVGTTYDGGTPFLAWVNADLGGQFDKMPPWLVSTGVFDPLGGYHPVAGASFFKGTEPGIDEEYRIGVFPATYPTMIPVAGARWLSDRTSGAWLNGFVLSGKRAPSAAQLDAGPVVADTLVPVAGVHMEPGDRDRYHVGAWVGSGFVTVLTACSDGTTWTAAPGTGC